MGEGGDCGRLGGGWGGGADVLIDLPNMSPKSRRQILRVSLRVSQLGGKREANEFCLFKTLGSVQSKVWE